MEKFKKGQMVPRRLGLVLTTIRKAQHCAKFGCDVEVDGKVVRPLSEGSVFIISVNVTRPMKNGTYRKAVAIADGVYILPRIVVHQTPIARTELLRSAIDENSKVPPLVAYL